MSIPQPPSYERNRNENNEVASVQPAEEATFDDMGDSASRVAPLAQPPAGGGFGSAAAVPQPEHQQPVFQQPVPQPVEPQIVTAPLVETEVQAIVYPEVETVVETVQYVAEEVYAPAPQPETSVDTTTALSLPDPETRGIIGGGKITVPVEAAFSPDIQHAAQLLMDYIGDDVSSEVLMNGPNEISHKVRGVRYHCSDIAFGSPEIYHRVINEVLLPHVDTQDRINGRTVIIEGQLELSTPGKAPMLARVHIVAPPGVTYAKVTIAKKPRFDLTLDDLSANGTLSQDEADFLKAAVRGRRTVLVSGPTGSGKTTFLQAISHCFDANDRVVVIEETPELRLPLGDVIYLRATLELPGMDESKIFDLGFWTKQANRMRMDRVIVGETRGGEMADWLIAANSGAEGSATTVHANSPRRAIDKVLALASKSEDATSESQLRREIAATLDLIIQINLVDGRHLITAIEEVSDTVAQATGLIQTNTIFEFDRVQGRHVAKGRPSDDFIANLAHHGVPVNPSWFRVS